MAPPIGYKQSPEHRAHVGAASRARWATPEFRQRMSGLAYHRSPLSAETKAKISAAKKGKPTRVWLPEMTRREALLYRKFRRLAYERAEALIAVFGS